MRSLCHLFLGMGLVGFLTLGCERHQFDDTKILHGDHGGHHDHGPEGSGHGHSEEGHGDEKEHAKKAHDAESDGYSGSGAGKPKAKSTEKDGEEPRDVGL